MQYEGLDLFGLIEAPLLEDPLAPDVSALGPFENTSEIADDFLVAPSSLFEHPPVTDYSPDLVPEAAHGIAAEAPVDLIRSLDGESLAVYLHEPTWLPDHFDGVGDPFTDAVHWHQQQAPNSCAVVVQGTILESLTGEPFDEQKLEAFADEEGWYDPETGTAPADVGKILEAAGIPVSQVDNADILDVADALERGDKIIVGLDAAEINQPLRDVMTGTPIEQQDAGHAVWVTGLDQGPDGSIHVLLNDPGHAGGQMIPVALPDFLNAWADFGNHLTVAHTPDGAE